MNTIHAMFERRTVATKAVKKTLERKEPRLKEAERKENKCQLRRVGRRMRTYFSADEEKGYLKA